MTHTEPLTPSTAKMSMAHTITRPLPSMFAVISSAPLRQKDIFIAAWTAARVCTKEYE